jgi:hypothetical protein
MMGTLLPSTEVSVSRASELYMSAHRRLRSPPRFSTAVLPLHHDQADAQDRCSSYRDSSSLSTSRVRP